MNPRDAWHYMQDSGEGVKTGLNIVLPIEHGNVECFVDDFSDEVVVLNGPEFLKRFRGAWFSEIV